MNLVTISAAAESLGIHPDSIRRWEKKGLIKPFRNGQNHRVFSQDEIARVHKLAHGGASTPFKVLKSKPRGTYHSVELFAGAGGLALGMENAGLHHRLLVEFDKHAAHTLRVNRPKWDVHAGDVAEVDFRGIQADVVTGGFPCQAFSYAGNKLGFEDTRGTLFFEFARCVKEIGPKVVVGENVRGLLSHDGGKTLKTMVAVLDELGYRVAWRLLRAQYLDVPQKRERLVIIGVRKGLEVPFCFPKEQDYVVTLRQALAGVPVSAGQSYTPRKAEVMAKVPAGGYWRDLPEKLQREYMGASYFHGGGKTGMARRLAWDEPSLTLTCNPAQKQTERCHPEETRPLNVREYARIQAFPDSWQFSGPTSAQYRQIGNAVPVNFGYHIARCVIAMLEGKPDAATMEVFSQMPPQTTSGTQHLQDSAQPWLPGFGWADPSRPQHPQ
jgi:DNA (cytosine-5)-methyltransferase 1